MVINSFLNRIMPKTPETLDGRIIKGKITSIQFADDTDVPFEEEQYKH